MCLPKVALLVLLCLILPAQSQSQTCQSQQYIIPYDPLDDGFDKGIDFIRGKDQLAQMIQNPSAETAKTYLLTIAPFSAPLFVMAGLTLAIFIATIVQVICFNTCSKDCCGNEINDRTYNVCCIRVMVAFFIVFSFFVICISIAALIVNSDLQKAIDYTNCNTDNIIYQTYHGNNNSTIPWSGINNFQKDIDIFSVNIQNDIPFLIRYFQGSTNPNYNAITSTSPGSLYANSQTFACANSALTLNCPFPSSVLTCTTPYTAQFNEQYCNTTFNGSAAYQINKQMQSNSTQWQNSTVNIAAAISSINLNPSNVQTLVNQVTNFTSSAGSYESTIQDGINKADQVINGLEIALYVFYGFILLMSLVGMVGICMSYFCLVFKCKFIMYVLWYTFFVLALVLFILSGIFLTSSILAYDSCLAYPFYFSNQTNYQQLNFNNAQIGDIFKLCFFNKTAVSMFGSFNDTTLLTQFGQLYSQYQLAVPSNQFSSVVTTIENQLISYTVAPNTVVISTASSQQQPSVALTQMNLFSNYTSPNTTQSCKLTQDLTTYNVINCGSFLINQAVGDPGCVVLQSPNISSIQSSRVSAFNTRGCNTDATTYQDRVNALINYGTSVTAMVQQLAPIASNPANPLQSYQGAYYSYYSAVLNFYNTEIQQTFNGFFIPYIALQDGSSCGFITASMNGIVDIACNQLQPYLNLLSALNITESVLVFLLFILAYFLTTRLNFYQFLDGNFANWGVKTIATPSINGVYTIDSKDVELLSTNRSVA